MLSDGSRDGPIAHFIRQSLRPLFTVECCAVPVGDTYFRKKLQMDGRREFDWLDLLRVAGLVLPFVLLLSLC